MSDDERVRAFWGAGYVTLAEAETLDEAQSTGRWMKGDTMEVKQ